MLKAEHIALRSLQEEDLRVLYKWINDRDTVLFNSPYKPISEYQHKNWYKNIQESNETRIFIIENHNSKVAIGSCQLHHIDSVHRSAELQIRIGEAEHRSKGFGTEAVNLLLKHGFSDLNLNRIYLNVFSDNSAAIKLYEKTGFKKEGILRSAVFIDGSYRDVIIMGLLREEYDMK